jgi:integrase
MFAWAVRFAYDAELFWSGSSKSSVVIGVRRDKDDKLRELRINTCGSTGEFQLRRRFQKGSLQQVRSGKAKRWIVLYYDTEGKRRFHTLGAGALTKSQAEHARDEFMRSINGCDGPEPGGLRPLLLSEFICQTYLPFQRGKWKKSTRGTAENRIQHHIVKGIGHNALKDFSLTALHEFLDGKADDGLSFSVVDHLRWDLNAIFEMAVAEKVIPSNPATRLYTPKHAPKGVTRAMSIEEVQVALESVELREQVLLHLAIFAGFRPGEMLALQRMHIAEDTSSVHVRQRVYRGEIDDPKSEPSKREVAIPPRTAELLREWMESAVGPEPAAFVFASKRGKPVWRDTLLYDHIRPKLKPHGLDWVDFQVMRRTHASIGHRLKLDPKVTADQRGHGVGVSIEEYTKTTLKDRAVAARKLEEAVLGKAKVVAMPRKQSA